MILQAVAAISVALPAAAFAMEKTAHVEVGGEARSFLIHVPDAPPPRGGYPVLLAFHGGGMQGRQMQRLTRLDEVADPRGVITVYPDGIDKHWNDGRSTSASGRDDVAFVSALLDQVEHTYQVNPRREYATGISNGALFTQRLACDLSNRISGIAPVAGSMPDETMAKCSPHHPVAVLQIAGTEDPIMPFAGGRVSDMGGAGLGGEVTSVEQTLKFWSSHDGCGPRGASVALASTARFDKTRVWRSAFLQCKPTAPVVALTVVGGGHTWPGGPQYALPRVVGWASRQVNASQEIVDFLLPLGESLAQPEGR